MAYNASYAVLATDIITFLNTSFFKLLAAINQP